MQKGKRKKVAGCKLRFCRKPLLPRKRNPQLFLFSRFGIPRSGAAFTSLFSTRHDSECGCIGPCRRTNCHTLLYVCCIKPSD